MKICKMAWLFRVWTLRAVITPTPSWKWQCNRVSIRWFQAPVAPSTASCEVQVFIHMESLYHKSIWWVRSRRTCIILPHQGEKWTRQMTINSVGLINSHLHMGIQWLWLGSNNMWSRILTITISKSLWRIGIRGRVSSRLSLLRYQGYKTLKNS